jgi:hypothetical protein
MAIVIMAGGVTFPAVAQTVFLNPDFEYVVDIPVGWGILDAEQTNFISFADSERTAVFQIIAFPGDEFATVDGIDAFIRERFGAEGDAAPFRYMGDPSIFADYQFSTGRLDVRGYMHFINGDELDFAVMTFVPVEHYEAYHDTLLSALDSFSLSRETRLFPGPVSQFYMGGLPQDVATAAGGGITGVTAGDTAEGSAGGSAGSGRAPAGSQSASAEIALPSGDRFALPPYVASEMTREASQVLIEREARVLSAYAPQPGESARIGDGPAPPWAVAWRRYFRMIYRDSYDRLGSVAEALFLDLAAAGVPREEMPARILEWLQSARYERTASLSDLMNPSSCLVAFAGDCDSLGLTYAIILDHLGFDAILMASIEYAHALVGVDVAGVGARFPFEGRQWLVAELTEEVGIGRIAEDMSDIGGWIGVTLDPTRGGR